MAPGASAGFGQAICRRLVADGYRDQVNEHIDKLQAFKKSWESLLSLQMDVTDLSQVDHALASLPKDGREWMFWSIMLAWLLGLAPA